MEDLPRIPPSDTRVIFIQIIISINIAIAMKLTNGKIIIHNIMMMMTNIILGVCRGDDDGSDDVDDDDGIEHLLVCPTRVGHVSQAHHLPQQDSKRPDIRLQGKWQKLGLGHQINFKCTNSKIISDCTRVQCTKIISHNTERLKTWIWNPAAACFLF